MKQRACPSCGSILTNPFRCNDCEWTSKNRPITISNSCMVCSSKDVYKRMPDGWLCYNHVAKQHRSFVHNMLDFKLANRDLSIREAWLYAMQFAPKATRFDEKYFDEHSKPVRGYMTAEREAELLARLKPPDDEAAEQRKRFSDC